MEEDINKIQLQIMRNMLKTIEALRQQIIQLEGQIRELRINQIKK